MRNLAGTLCGYPSCYSGATHIIQTKTKKMGVCDNHRDINIKPVQTDWTRQQL